MASALGAEGDGEIQLPKETLQWLFSASSLQLVESGHHLASSLSNCQKTDRFLNQRQTFWFTTKLSVSRFLRRGMEHG